MQNIICTADKMNNIKNNKYLQKLNEKINLDNFIKSQIYFIAAVDNWSKILGIMISKVPSYKERIVLINNLKDEHGEENINNCHVITFKKFILSLLEITKKQEQEYFFKENKKYINNFINGLYELVKQDWIYAISALAMIEYVYINVSESIHKYISNFIDKNEIHHYSTHEIIDKHHAQELFSIIEPYYKNNEDIIENGIKYGYELLNKLYEDLEKYNFTF